MARTVDDLSTEEMRSMIRGIFDLFEDGEVDGGDLVKEIGDWFAVVGIEVNIQGEFDDDGNDDQS